MKRKIDINIVKIDLRIFYKIIGIFLFPQVFLLCSLNDFLLSTFLHIIVLLYQIILFLAVSKYDYTCILNL